MNFLLGKWEDYRTGRARIGQGFKTCTFIRESNYIYSNNKSIIDPQDRNPEGEIHGDWGIISNDSFVNKFTMCDCYSLGYINSNVLEYIPENPAKYEFNSDNLENVPEGWKARIKLEKIDEDTFEETLDPSQTGRDYVTYL